MDAEWTESNPPLKAGRYGRDPLPGLGTRPDTTRLALASGTCRKCGRIRVRVRRAEIVTMDRRDLHPFPAGVVVAIAPALAPHKVPGRNGAPCAGEGEPPAETRWHSTAYDAIVRDYGSGAVTLRVRNG